MQVISRLAYGIGFSPNRSGKADVYVGLAALRPAPLYRRGGRPHSPGAGEQCQSVAAIVPGLPGLCVFTFERTGGAAGDMCSLGSQMACRGHVFWISNAVAREVRGGNGSCSNIRCPERLFELPMNAHLDCAKDC